MADYYTVLKRATEGLDTIAVRRMVYDKVRTTLIRELKSIDPPLANEQISRERVQLEEAIRQVEKETAAQVQIPQGGRAQDRVEARASEDEDYWQARDAPANAPPENYLKRRIPARSANWPPQEDDEEEDDAPTSEDAAHRRHPRAILLLAISVALIGGLAIVAWSQRTAIVDLFAGRDDEAREIVAPETRTAGGDLPVAEADADAAVRVIDVPPPPEVSSGPTADAVASRPSPTSDAAVNSESAVLYETPLDMETTGYVTAIAATVNWRFEDDVTYGPEIRADLQVPERQMTLHLVIRSNTDPTLPASHIVEMEIDTPPDFPGKSIRGVPRLVLKSSENDAGEPLIGAAVTISGGYFWIALSAADTHLARNLQLLKEGSWIDLPLIYESGQTAVLSFAKGTAGADVFERALTAGAINNQ
jgi:hypothetical protein